MHDSFTVTLSNVLSMTADRDLQPHPIALSIADCELLWQEAEDVHPSTSRRSGKVRAQQYCAMERLDGDAEGIFIDAVYASGVFYTFERRLDALVVRNVHRAAGYTAELLVERDTWDEAGQEDLPPLHYVVTSRIPSWTSAARE